MTEQEWLACTDPEKMLNFLRGKTSERKLRLFALACCYRVNRLMANRESQAAVAFVERHVEHGVVRRKGRATTERAAYKAHVGVYNNAIMGPEGIERAKGLIISSATAAACWALSTNPNDAARFASGFTAVAAGWEALVASRPASYAEFADSCKRPEQIQQAGLLRDLFGNPFRPVALDPAWRTPQVIALAQSIYDQRAFDRLPLLADALEEAGCDTSELLNHCREPGPHVRGCWVLDAVLSKE